MRLSNRLTSATSASIPSGCGGLGGRSSVGRWRRGGGRFERRAHAERGDGCSDEALEEGLGRLSACVDDDTISDEEDERQEA